MLNDRCAPIQWHSWYPSSFHPQQLFFFSFQLLWNPEWPNWATGRASLTNGGNPTIGYWRVRFRHPTNIRALDRIPLTRCISFTEKAVWPYLPTTKSTILTLKFHQNRFTPRFERVSGVVLCLVSCYTLTGDLKKKVVLTSYREKWIRNDIGGALKWRCVCTVLKYFATVR